MKNFLRKYYKGRFKKGHKPERSKESYIKQGKQQKIRFKNDSEYRNGILKHLKKVHAARLGKPAWNSGKKMPKGWYEKSGLINPKTGHPWNYKTGKQKRYGYIFIYDKNTRKFIAEHRMVMERVLKRKLRNNELIHHRNQIKDDNRKENLEIVIRKIHFGEVICPFCNNKFKVK